MFGQRADGPEGSAPLESTTPDSAASLVIRPKTPARRQEALPAFASAMHSAVLMPVCSRHACSAASDSRSAALLRGARRVVVTAGLVVLRAGLVVVVGDRLVVVATAGVVVVEVVVTGTAAVDSAVAVDGGDAGAAGRSSEHAVRATASRATTTPILRTPVGRHACSGGYRRV